MMSENRDHILPTSIVAASKEIPVTCMLPSALPELSEKQEIPYSIFSTRKKHWIVAMASMSAFFGPLSANSYFPAMGKIEKDLNISSQQVNLSVTVFMIFQAVSPSFWSAVADSRGRRPIYLITLLIYILSCVGLALCTDYTLLLVLRMFQAFGACSILAIGAGTIADIAVPSERGGYIGWYSLGFSAGPVLGPAMGGLLSQYLGWRSMFWAMVIACGLHWVILFFCFPETLRSLVGPGSGYANPTPYQWWQQRRREKILQDDESVTMTVVATDHLSANGHSHRWYHVLLMPLEPLLYAKEKDVLQLLILYGVQYGACYSVLASIPFLFGSLYNTSELVIGMCFLANGLGYVFGSIIQGKLLNYYYDQQMSESFTTVDFPIEQVRMKAMWVHAIGYNLVLVAYGWCLVVKVHLAVQLCLHFAMGLTSQAMFNAIQTLLVDLFAERSASITASNNFFRGIFGAAATVLILPVIQVLGIGWTFTLISGLLLLSRICIYVELAYGPRWRREREVRDSKSTSFS